MGESGRLEKAEAKENSETYEKTTSWGKLSPALRDIVIGNEVNGQKEEKVKRFRS